MREIKIKVTKILFLKLAKLFNYSVLASIMLRGGMLNGLIVVEVFWHYS